MKLFKAPEKYPENDTIVFLGGSIEMGKAIDWQTEYANRLKNVDNLTVLNPRRDDWDSSWIQDTTPRN